MTQAQLNTSVLLSGCQHVADMDRQADFDRRLAAEKAVKLEKHGAAAAPIIDAAHTAARAAFAKGRSPVWVVVDAANAARQAAGMPPMKVSHKGQLADFLGAAGPAAVRDEDMMTLLIMRHEAAGITTETFPRTVRLGGVDCAASYLHQPGDPRDFPKTAKRQFTGIQTQQEDLVGQREVGSTSVPDFPPPVCSSPSG